MTNNVLAPISKSAKGEFPLPIFACAKNLFFNVNASPLQQEVGVGLIVRYPTALGPKEGDYSVWLAWRKGRVETILQWGNVFTLPFLKACWAK